MQAALEVVTVVAGEVPPLTLARSSACSGMRVSRFRFSLRDSFFMVVSPVARVCMEGRRADLACSISLEAGGSSAESLASSLEEIREHVAGQRRKRTNLAMR